MENSPLPVCHLQPARAELMAALLDAGGRFADSEEREFEPMLLLRSLA